MFQQLTAIGFCAADPTLRYTPNGSAVVSFNVATNRKYKLADGTQKEETVWLRCQAWAKLAELINEYVHKGSKLFLQGTLVADESGNPKLWNDKEGKPHASFELRVDQVKFLDSKSDAKEPVKEDEPMPF